MSKFMFQTLLAEDRLREVTMGAEMEVYVLDEYDGSMVLLSDESVITNIYNEFDYRVYKDFYEYQLELRTDPHESWEDVAEEMISLLKQADKVAREYSCKLAVVSYIKGAMFNGFHVHIKPKHREDTAYLTKLMMAIYPFALTISQYTRSSPHITDAYMFIYSLRQLQSCHVGTPPLAELNEYAHGMVSDSVYDRYKDVVLNFNKAEGRHRIKDVVTVEIRVYDVVGSRDAIMDVLELTYYVATHVKIKKMMQYFSSYEQCRAIEFLMTTSREQMVSKASWVNPIILTDYQSLYREITGRSIFNATWLGEFNMETAAVTNPNFHEDIRYPI